MSSFEKMVAELHRILKPNGVLLVAVPHIDRLYPELQGFGFDAFWRFTKKGLRILLANRFGAGNVMVRGYGNSLTAAGHLRGLVGRDFTRAEVEYQDPRFAIVLCASATSLFKSGTCADGSQICRSFSGKRKRSSRRSDRNRTCAHMPRAKTGESDAFSRP